MRNVIWEPGPNGPVARPMTEAEKEDRKYWARRKKENQKARGKFWGASSASVHANNTYIYGRNGHAGGWARNGERA